MEQLPLSVTVDEKGPCRRVLRIDLPKEIVDAEYENVVGEFVKMAALPGFRKGRAPRSVVERRFTGDIIEETKSRLVPRSYRQALQSKEIHPVSIVGVDDVKVAKGAPLVFNVTVDVAPKFELPPHKSIALKGQPSPVGDAEVAKFIDSLRERAARFEPVTGRKAKDGDLVQVDYEATSDGKPVAEIVPKLAGIGAAKDYWLMVADEGLIPGLGKALEGAAEGESREVTISFPADFRVGELAGKTASYSLKVKGLREKSLPAVDENFAKELGVDSVELLRDEVRKRLAEQADAEEKRRLKNEIVKYLLERTSMDVPESLVEEETRRFVHEVVSQGISKGVSKDEIAGKKDDIMNAATRSSQDRVKLGFILDEIARSEKVEVSEGEMDQALSAMAARYRTDKQSLRAELEKRDAFDSLRRDVLADKTLDVLLKNAKIQ